MYVIQEVTTIKYERDKATAKLNDLTTVRKNQESLIHRLQKRLLLVTRERDSYRYEFIAYVEYRSIFFSLLSDRKHSFEFCEWKRKIHFFILFDLLSSTQNEPPATAKPANSLHTFSYIS